MRVEHLTQLTRTLRAQRRRAIVRLQKLIQPKLRASGYGPVDDALQICCWTGEKCRELNGYSMQYVYGFVEDGIVTDVAGGGLITERYIHLPLEDLVLLTMYVAKHIKELE